jgi:hypothetical protein
MLFLFELTDAIFDAGRGRHSVSRMRRSLRPARLSAAGAMPASYFPVSTPRASGE